MDNLGKGAGSAHDLRKWSGRAVFALALIVGAFLLFIALNLRDEPPPDDAALLPPPVDALAAEDNAWTWFSRCPLPKMDGHVAETIVDCHDSSNRVVWCYLDTRHWSSGPVAVAYDADADWHADWHNIGYECDCCRVVAKSCSTFSDYGWLARSAVTTDVARICGPDDAGPAIAAVRRGLECPAYRPPAPLLDAAGFPALAALRTTQWALVLQAREAQVRGDYRTAMAAVTSAFRLGRRLALECSSSVDHVAGLAMLDFADYPLARLMADPALPRADLDRLQALPPSAAELAAAFTNAVRGDYAARVRALAPALVATNPPVAVSADGRRHLPFAYLYHPNATRRRFAAWYGYVLAHAGVPYRDVPTCAESAAGKEAPGAAPDFTVAPNCFGGILAARLLPVEPEDPFLLEGLAAAQMELLRAAIACQRYRRDYGALPPSLTALVPDYLAAVPRDPYDGAPVGYAPGLLRTRMSVSVDRASGIITWTPRFTRRTMFRFLPQPSGDAGIRAERARLFALRDAGETDRYLVEARAALARNRDDLLAADVATTLAARGGGGFAAFAAEYAAGSPRLAAQFGEIAAHAGHDADATACARMVLRDGRAPFALVLRAGKDLDAAGAPAEAAAAARRAAGLATKRYQKEDAELFLCRLAAKSGGDAAAVRRRLAALATGAVMPDVRRAASAALAEVPK